MAAVSCMLTSRHSSCAFPRGLVCCSSVHPSTKPFDAGQLCVPFSGVGISVRVQHAQCGVHTIQHCRGMLYTKVEALRTPPPLHSGRVPQPPRRHLGTCVHDAVVRTLHTRSALPCVRARVLIIHSWAAGLPLLTAYNTLGEVLHLPLGNLLVTADVC